MGVLAEACLPLVSTEVNKGKGDMRGSERTCVAIDGKRGGEIRWFIYILLSLPLAS